MALKICTTFEFTFYYEDGSEFHCFLRSRLIPSADDWRFSRNTRRRFGNIFPDAEYIGVKWVQPSEADYKAIDKLNSERSTDANVFVKNERGEIEIVR